MNNTGQDQDIHNFASNSGFFMVWVALPNAAAWERYLSRRPDFREDTIGLIANSDASITVVHIDSPQLERYGYLKGTPLYKSCSEERCNQVAERMVAAHKDYLKRCTVADTHFSNKTAESIKVLLLEDFTDTIQRIVDSAEGRRIG